MKQVLRDSIHLMRDFLMVDLRGFLKNVFGLIKAILRLILLTIDFFLCGLNNVLFAGREIADFEFVFDLLSQDIDKLNYIDKLNAQMMGSEEILEEEGLYIDEDEED